MKVTRRLDRRLRSLRDWEIDPERTQPAYPGAFANLGCSEDENPFDLDRRRFFPWNDYFWPQQAQPDGTADREAE